MRKISKNLLLAFVVITSSIMLSSCAETKKEGTVDLIKKRGTLIVATTGTQFPYTFKNEEGNLDGVDIYIARSIASKMGVKVKFVLTELPDIIEAVKEGKADIAISGLSITDERSKEVSFTKPYVKTGKSILSKSVEIQNGKVEDVNKEEVVLAVIDNSSSLEFVTKNYPNATIVKTNNLNESKEVLFSGRANGLVADYGLCEFLSFDKQNAAGEYNFKLLKSEENVENLGIAVSKNSPLLFDMISELLAKVKEEDFATEVDNTWMKFLN